MIETYALHQIKNPENTGFSAADYSRFKYGDSTVARSFGIDLANGFIEQILSQTPIKQQITVISSPYSFIPTATFTMKTYFVTQLNRWLVQQGFDAAEEAKVHRTVTYKDDYGSLNAEERMRLIGKDSFHIDAAFVENKTLIFLDDIKITGSHERMILKMMDKFELNNDVFMLYFAELINENVHPRFENYLNNYTVRTLNDVENIINSGNFVANTRVVKFILQSNPNDFDAFINRQSASFLENLYDLAISNGYQKMEVYQQNLARLLTADLSCVAS